ncbi:37S ribosomal protein S24, mitochondrial [Phialemonium atrogriseum]|uniref:37S ribosomal protein S24, mitochondrial n=1 Tax=Phialemonium atrogriseum TaxID=1093897 RepID=A0AAJ0BQX9_9PEZI|nr:37S ribosomal protein S24, mitochondrial [Phialemonium atrogriseum]KAK1762407.1 37S ribosomal protein S24, mitochondrial [Phialemonium atrogriseum]
MAAGAQSLRLCLRSYRQAPAFRALRPNTPQLRRALSTTTIARRREANDKDAVDLGFDRVYDNPGDVVDDLLRTELLPAKDRNQLAKAQSVWSELPHEQKQALQKDVQEVRQAMGPLRRIRKAKRSSFWGEEETDSDLITDELGEDDFEEDDILSMGHGKLEEHRELREYARIAIWEMPLLSKHAKPFQPPVQGEVLRFRYTSYMGEFHPAEKKVVVEFCPRDLDLSEVQQSKLAKLAGPRYNPETDIIRMGCEMFEHQAQNKRYLGDLVEKMVAEAKDPTDTFEDIPLDTRHHTFKTKPKFPKEWRLTPERRAELEALRQQSFLLDESKKNEGALVDGSQRIQHALAPPPASDIQGKVAELLTVPAQQKASGPKAKRR